MNLNVFLQEKYVGTLFTTINDLIFRYDESYEECNRPAISHSLPVIDFDFTSFDCLYFFNALLPEGQLLENISTKTFISEYSTMKLLKLLGGDCEGAIQFIISYEESPEECEKILKDARELNVKNYQELNEDELCYLLKQNTVTPFFISNKSFKITLCGDKDKLALSFFDNKWHLPMRYAPTTHILKPSFHNNEETLALNEFICTKMAEMFNINVPKCQLLVFDNMPVFITERFDRIVDNENRSIKRIHQESFSQALSIKSYTKYQKDGGASFQSSINLIRDACKATVTEDIENMVYIMIFNYLIGNCEAHGKNFALLYDNPKVPRLAPFFDLTCSTIYPEHTTKMAMSIGGEYDINKITKDNFINELDTCGISHSILIEKLSYIDKHFEQVFVDLDNLPELKNYKYLLNWIREQFNSRLDQLI